MKNVEVMGEVLGFLQQRMAEQEFKHGGDRQIDEPIQWLSILTEELGEYAECVNHRMWGGDKGSTGSMASEMLDIAAVAVWAIGWHLRGEASIIVEEATR